MKGVLIVMGVQSCQVFQEEAQSCSQSTNGHPKQETACQAQQRMLPANRGLLGAPDCTVSHKDAQRKSCGPKGLKLHDSVHIVALTALQIVADVLQGGDVEFIAL